MKPAANDFFVSPDIAQAETLPPEAFTSQGFLARELATIFKSHWLMVPQRGTLESREDPRTLVDQLADVRPAFGRGQVYTLPGGAHVQLNLVKNPASFRQGLASYVREGTTVVVAVNDLVADGRDLSWLWDVDFSPLRGRQVLVTGDRAMDLAVVAVSVVTGSVMPPAPSDPEPRR